MFIFVSGGTRSGKSEWAERAAVALSSDTPRVYLATAQVSDEDMRRRVARHQAARKDRGFLTLERTRDLSGIFPNIPSDATVLLECLPNWLANEMFTGDGSVCDPALLEENIFQTALALKERCRHLLIVSDDIFSDGVTYTFDAGEVPPAPPELHAAYISPVVGPPPPPDDLTESYRRLLGRLHVRLAGAADVAVECVAGLVRWAKGEMGFDFPSLL